MTTDTDNTANNNTEGQAQDNQQTTQANNGQQGTPQPAPAAGDQQNNPQGAQDGQDTLLGGNQQQAAQPPAGAPEKYDFTPSIPEGTEIDQAIADEFSGIAKGMNLTNDQANQLAAYGIKYGQQVAETVQQQLDAEVNGWGETAKKELGSDFDKTMQLCGVALETVEKQVPGIRKALNETGAGNRIEVIRMVRILGELLQSDPGKLSNVGGAAAPAQSETWYNNTKR